MSKSLGNDAIKLTVSKVITLLVGMITAMLLSRYLTLKEFGTYSQILLSVNILTSIFILGLPTSVNYFLASTNDINEKQKFLSMYFTLSTILSFLTGFILALISPLLVNYFNNPLIKSFVFILILYPWTKIMTTSIENILVVYKKTMYILFFRVLNSLFLISAVLLTIFLDMSLYNYMILFIIINFIFAISVYFIVKVISGGLSYYFEKEQAKQIFKFSIPLGLATFVGTISVELDKLIIGKFYNTEQLAIYTNAAREMPVTIVAASLTAVLMPYLVRLLKENKNNEAVELWGNVTTLSYLFIGFFATALFVFAPEVISLLYSEKYLSGVWVFRIYAVVLLLRTTYFGLVLNALGKTKFIFYSSLAALVLNLLLSYSFYKIFGFIGPAIATFMSILLVGSFQLFVTSKITNIRFSRILNWRELGIITILNIIMGCLFTLIKQYIYIDNLTNNVVESVILGVCWVSIYIIITLRFIKQKWVIIQKA